MYQIVSGSSDGFSDVQAFLEQQTGLEESSNATVEALFSKTEEIVLGRAPGRLDVMGGIADYSGSLVLQMPTREATIVALQADPSRELTIVSLLDGTSTPLRHQMSLDDLEDGGGGPVSYESARAWFHERPDNHWAAYVAGVFLVLMREKGCAFAHGARILVNSDVPESKGVSSSAALEVASMQAVAAAFDIKIDARELAILCQKVENLVVGAPCGIMDQISSSCGEPGRLLALLCQPADLLGQVEIPEDIAFWGIDSGIRHSVSGSDYGSVRIGAFMGYRILADLAGFAVETRSETVHIEDTRWSGYLANVRPAEFEQHFAAHMPLEISGAEFLARYSGTSDEITRVDPDRSYAVRVPTRHPIYEHERVRTFAELLGETPNPRRLEILGELMYQTHASYSACGLGSGGTDRLVELVRERGAAEGLYGAKITGGGSGGTVAVIGQRGAEGAVHSIAESYAEESGHQPVIFSGSSMGAGGFGHLRLVSTDSG